VSAKHHHHKGCTAAIIGEVAVAVLSKAKWVPQVSISHPGSLRFSLGSLCFTFSQRRDSSRKRIPSQELHRRNSRRASRCRAEQSEVGAPDVDFTPGFSTFFTRLALLQVLVAPQLVTENNPIARTPPPPNNRRASRCRAEQSEVGAPGVDFTPGFSTFFTRLALLHLFVAPRLVAENNPIVRTPPPQ
jgi:hypothetical protein